MKGFPNQVAKLQKLATGVRCIEELLEDGRNPRDNGVLGEALVRAHVAGAGRAGQSIDAYLAEQRTKDAADQSPRTTARGLRELYRLLGLVEEAEGELQMTELGREAAGFADAPLDEAHTAFWRGVVRNLVHDGGDGETSHPYQVLLRLVQRVPGITRGKCALALEATNDSPGELDRIVALAGLPESGICGVIGVKKTNWENAKKVLPSIAQQLGDVIVGKKGGETTFTLADAPGLGGEEGGTAPRAGSGRRRAAGARRVTPDTIGRAGTVESLNERIPTPPDPADAARAVAERQDRLRRHNLIVQALTRRLAGDGVRFFENPFDILALRGAACVLVEVKSLDGTAGDERDRVLEALAQLLYYEPFAAKPLAGEAEIRKIACFEAAITDAHLEWLNANGIGVVWLHEGEFYGDELACEALGEDLDEIG